MRYLIILTITIFFCTNIIKNNSILHRSKKSYKIFKIDSTDSFHIIYMKSGGVKYKVVSQKQIDSTSDNLIQLGNEYDLTLISLFNRKIKFGDKYIKAIPLIVDCIEFKDEESICKEKELGINDVHYSPDLYGLNIIKK